MFTLIGSLGMGRYSWSIAGPARHLFGLWPFLALLVLSVGWLAAAPQDAGLSLGPDNTGTGLPGQTVIYVHTLVNEGDGPDTVTLTGSSSRGWPVTVSPDEVTMDPSEDVLVLITLVVPAAAQPGQIDITTVTATSGADPSVTASATDTTLVPSPVLLPIVLDNSDVLPPECQLTIPPPANPLGADLLVTGITILPGSPPAGQVATVAVTIKNQGQTSVAMGNNFYLDFYVDPIPEPPGRRQPGILSWGVQGADMAAGVSRTYGADFVFSAGWHHLYAQVDTDDSVVEANEVNNVYGCMFIYIGGSEKLSGLESTTGQRSDLLRPTATSVAPTDLQDDIGK